VNPPLDLRAVVAQNIRVVAEARGLGLNALADFAGVSRSQLFNVLNGKSSASLDWLSRLAEALGVEPWELLVEPRRSGRKRERGGRSSGPAERRETGASR